MTLVVQCYYVASIVFEILAILARPWLPDGWLRMNSLTVTVISFWNTGWCAYAQMQQNTTRNGSVCLPATACASSESDLGCWSKVKLNYTTMQLFLQSGFTTSVLLVSGKCQPCELQSVLFIRSSTRLSVTLLYCVKMLKPIVQILSLSDSAIALVFSQQNHVSKFGRGHPKRGR